MSSLRVEAQFNASALSSVEWMVEGATLTERLNRAYTVEVDLRTTMLGADLPLLLGSSSELSLARGPHEQAVLGIVTGFREGEPTEHERTCTLQIEPALAVLRHRRDTRIFQEMSVPQILEEVLAAALAPYGREVTVDLRGSYPEREYTVQYRETDHDFVHRLMEEEGIVYYFEHEGSAERLILVDDKSQHPPVPAVGGALLSFQSRSDDSDVADRAAIRSFVPHTRMRPTKLSLRRFDWTRPALPIEGQSAEGQSAEGQSAGAQGHADGAAVGPERESYEHDGPLTLHSYAHTYTGHDADRQVQIRRELQRRDARLGHGTSTVPALRPGLRFDLNGHPNTDLNAAYTLVEVEHRWLGHTPHGADRPAGAELYYNRFECLPAEVQWRPTRERDRVRIHGIQTATVVTPPGEEIHTDVHGRVKVRFHWDRLAPGDDRSSCWIRVMQAMGGRGWGFTFIPRVGMEVVVSFIDGDPDQPLITGCVYNPDNPPPIDLPADKTRTTIKSDSSPGGGGNNEIRLEDKAGEEQVYVHAQKDMDEVVEHDQTTHVMNDQSSQIDHDRSVVVDHNETKWVKNNMSVTVGKDLSTRVIGNETREVLGIRETTVHDNDAFVTDKNRYATVTMSDTLLVGQHFFLACGANKVEIDNAEKLIKLTTGQATITMKGPDISVEANGTLTLKGQAGVFVESGGGDVQIKGGPMVKINP